MTIDNATVLQWADQIALQLIDLPENERDEALVRVLLDYRQYLTEQFPDRESDRKRLLGVFFRALTKRIAEIGTTGGNTGGTA